LKTVRILLGLACNYACAYCSQAVSRAAETGRESVGDVDDFLDRLPEWLHTGPDEPVRFEFWGGESFVYWKKIQCLARRLRGMYPNAAIWIPTNGSLLDKAKVAFLVEQGISVGISHDGPGQHLRGPDPFDDPQKAAALRAAADALAPLGRISVNSVLTRDHHSLLALRDFFAERFARGSRGCPPDSNQGRDPRPSGSPPGGWLPQLFTEGLAMPHEAGETRLPELSGDDHRRIRRTLFSDMARPDMIPMAFVTFKLRQVFESLATERRSDSLGQRCGLDRPDSITVRLDGRVIVCPSGEGPNRRIGSVHDFDAIRVRHCLHWSHRDECRHCPALQLCNGACMMLGDGTAQHRTACHNYFTVEIACLALALYLLTDARLTRIEADQIRFPGVTAFDF
jgi:uncharacterized protein